MRDLIVVSDLHLGRGRNPQTGRYYELEAFFYDQDFFDFCAWACNDAKERGSKLVLVLNGDTFDLLRLDPLPLPDEAEPIKNFAPTMTPSRAAAEIERILAGHPRFVQAIAKVLASGHEVVMLPGNHDIEVQWAPVQEAIRQALMPALGMLAGAIERLRFEPWFLYEPGRIWIEHGCQYDPENAFRFPLRRGLATAPDAVHEAELDDPLGNFFQRYLYNAFGHITFIVPSTRANARYLKWLAVNQPVLLIRIVRSHWRFWWHLLKRVLTYPTRDRTRLADTHKRELHELARESELDDKLFAIDGLKQTHADVTQAIRGFGWQGVKFVGATLLVGTLVLGLWFAGYHSINQAELGFMGKSLLFLMFSFVFLLLAFATVLYTMMRGTYAVPPQPMRRAAAHIARMVDVPVVTFGHTHEEVLWRTDRGEGAPSWYFNTGTWIAVFTHDVLLPRERVQFTFLRVRGKEAELMHWSPGRGHPVPVILLDEPGPAQSGIRPDVRGPE